jgi:Tetratricopeptide repeat.
MKHIFLSIVFIFSLSQLYAQDNYGQIIEKALNAAKKDSLSQAEKLFKEALHMDPANMRNALLFTNLGTVQRRMGKIDDALESYSLALNITPYSVVTLLNRASLYLEKNNYDKAYLDYCNVLDIDRKNKEALLFRAYIYMNRREYKEARIDYNALLTEDAKNRTAMLGLVLLNQKEMKYREALGAVGSDDS